MVVRSLSLQHSVVVPLPEKVPLQPCATDPLLPCDTTPRRKSADPALVTEVVRWSVHTVSVLRRAQQWMAGALTALNRRLAVFRM